LLQGGQQQAVISAAVVTQVIADLRQLGLDPAHRKHASGTELVGKHQSRALAGQQIPEHLALTVAGRAE